MHLLALSKITTSTKGPGAVRNIIEVSTVDVTAASLLESDPVDRSQIQVGHRSWVPPPDLLHRHQTSPLSGHPDTSCFANSFNQRTLLEKSILRESCLRKSHPHQWRQDSKFELKWLHVSVISTTMFQLLKEQRCIRKIWEPGRVPWWEGYLVDLSSWWITRLYKVITTETLSWNSLRPFKCLLAKHLISILEVTWAPALRTAV